MPLIDCLATTEALETLFSDASLLQAMLDFEAALAKVEAEMGIIPAAAAEAIANAARAEHFDCDALSREALRAATLAIPVVKALTEQVRSSNAEAAGYVHWGATSQDVTDTAMSFLLRRAQEIFKTDIARLERALRLLSDIHKNSVMMGRTLLQAAPPVTFGMKAAQWAAATRRSKVHLLQSFDEAAVLQLGGATGTLAALGNRGLELRQRLSAALPLGPVPAAPWHTQRDCLARLVCECGILTSGLGKMASDISLLMQFEVAEVSEPASAGRGGSSTLPNKKNPSGCAVALAAATRVPSLVGAFLSAMVQQHERGLGGSQAEWPILRGVIQSTGVALAAMAEVAEGLKVNPARMRENLQATRGTIFAERAMILLAGVVGRVKAHELLSSAARRCEAERRSLVEILATMPDVQKHLDPATLKEIDAPEQYLGSTEGFRQALLDEDKES